MDIKLKNKTIHNMAFVLAMYLFSFSVISIGNIVRNSDYFTSSYYFISEGFEAELNNYFNDIRVLYTDYLDYNTASDDDKATESAIAELKSKNDSEVQRLEDIIRENSEYSIHQANAAGNKDLAEKLTKERDQKIEKIRKEYSKTIDEIKAEIISIKDNTYNMLKDRIASREDIKYYIKNKNGEVFSNLFDPKSINEYIKNQTLFSIEFPQRYDDKVKYETVNEFFWQTMTIGYVAIPKDLNKASNIYVNYHRFEEIRSQLIIELILAILFSLAAVLLLLYLRKERNADPNNLQYTLIEFYGKIPLDIRALILITALPFAYLIFGVEFFLSRSFGIGHLVILTLVALYISYLYLSLQWTLTFIKGKGSLQDQWHGCSLYYLLKLLRDSLAFKGLVFKMVLVLLPTVAYGGFLGLAMSAHANNAQNVIPLVVLATVIYFFIAPVYLLTKLRQYNQIVIGTAEIVSGNFNMPIESKGKGSLAQLGNNINNMKAGVKKALEDHIKSERLKTELITNVSHDLKTPLTSIINYVDFLKRENLTKEEYENYVSILEKKAQRMKLLIEDLFEASKLSSGTVELSLERIDVAALLYQALGEFDERIKSSSLTFKVNAVKQKIYADLDGRKTWRVFENLIGNILKYSLPNTRVYIDLEEVQNKAVLTMKNISAYELAFDPNELFERFKRGDESRNTEGSGLGLTIAKSIVELQGGNLSIDIDGDLFKVTVEFTMADVNT
ncbi:MAG: sensor histidine kinase [Clostridia bacterium]|nr:sensor histidine kinase [Clostridia bacterium]